MPSTLSLKHARLTRWTHWVNFPLLAIMIMSGIGIYWANAAYSINYSGSTLFHFFPDWVFRSLGLEHELARSIAWHFFFMWLFLINGVIYAIYCLSSGHWREIAPDRSSPIGAIQVTLHDLGLRPEAPPQLKYNDAQRIAYSAIALSGLGSILTGLAIYKPASLSLLTSALGGYEWARFEHFALTIGYLLFFVIHILQVARAGISNFIGMVTGYEIVRPDTVTADE